ncbi:IS66 family transposase [Escherichia coli]|uniref:IS66 family transposase n=2 Tax=Escherichia coli TaxID=562 RepID=UPI001DAD970E|nr:IS66 family transposase [Escherichia coli]EHA4943298.1 IS66 family transposase [Escherichia coli]EKF6999945.1 IS66 family transposase [Escherichia coli]MCN2400178.1 IS66 family transposase [Escherichia coli]MCZ2835522.1 IS66 family transposase [Escherichia coli]
MNDISSDDIFLLKQRLAEQEALIHALQEKLNEREREIDHLQAQLDKLRRMNFGSRSEKVSRRIAQMEADLNRLQKESDTLTGRVYDPAVQRPLRQTRTRKPFPESLPRDEKRLLPAAPCCPNCGGSLSYLGEDTAEQLELMRSAFRVIRTVREKHACTQCDAIVQAPAPSRPIERGIAGPGLLARVLTSKYAEHTPLYRQSEIYGRQGVELSRSLLSGWVDACCRQLSPLEEALHGYVLTDGKLHADDTPVPVLLPGNKKTKTGRLWTYVRDDRNAGSTLAPAVWFAYSPDRKGIHPQTHLAGFSGVLQADAYAGFNELYRDGRITEAACWAHARRKIHDVHVRTPSALTEEALKRIGELYAIEAEIKGMTAEQRLAERQLKTKPLLKSLESWLREKMKTLSRHSELAKAFAYALNQWPALTYYADDGWAEADNNIAENALRMVSLGRKNYLFFGSDHGGERGALLYSLIGTCKLNGVEPESYLRYVLDVIADWPINRVGELLPWRVALPTE